MDNYEHTPGGKPFNDLDAYFNDDHLSEDDKKLLAELDAIDASTAELAVEFTDTDILNNAALLGQMALKRGHANNVECNSYTYVINVYQRDAVNGTYMYTRIYEFANNVALELIDLFKNFNAHFIHRSSTESFAAANEPHVTHIEKRQINVYDLIVPEGFDIDATHYYYRETITCFEPWETTPEAWESTLREGWVDTFDELNESMKFETTELYHLKMTRTTPHVLNTRNPFSMSSIKEKKDVPTVIFKTQDI